LRRFGRPAAALSSRVLRKFGRPAAALLSRVLRKFGRPAAALLSRVLADIRPLGGGACFSPKTRRAARRPSPRTPPCGLTCGDFKCIARLVA
jgi:hypothetical protein